MLKRDYAIVGRAQATRCFQHAHGGRNVTHRNAGNHGRGGFCVDLGAVGQQACIQRDKLLGRLRLTPQQRRADLGATIDLQDDVWQLRRANGFAQELVRAAQPGSSSMALMAGIRTEPPSSILSKPFSSPASTSASPGGLRGRSAHHRLGEGVDASDGKPLQVPQMDAERLIRELTSLRAFKLCLPAYCLSHSRTEIPGEMLSSCIAAVHFGHVNFRGLMSFRVDRYANVLLRDQTPQKLARAN